MMKALLCFAVLVGLASATIRWPRRKALDREGQMEGQREGQREGQMEGQRVQQVNQRSCRAFSMDYSINKTDYKCHMTDVVEMVLEDVDYLEATVDAVEVLESDPSEANLEAVSGTFNAFVGRVLGDYDLETHKYTPGLFDKMLDRLLKMLIRLYIRADGFDDSVPRCKAMENFGYETKLQSSENSDGLTKEQYREEMARRVKGGLNCFINNMEEVKGIEEMLEKERFTEEDAIYLVTVLLEELHLIRRESQRFVYFVSHAYDKVTDRGESREDKKKESKEQELENLLRRFLTSK